MRKTTLLFSSLVLLTLAACSEPPPPPLFTEPSPLIMPAGPDSEGPRLFASRDGQVVLSWMERLEEGGALRYSVLANGAWQKPGDVVSDPRMFVNWADVPAVVPLAGDSWLAYWLSMEADAPYAYGIRVAHSADGGQSWSEPVTPHTDGTPTEHGFVSVSRDADSTHLIWLDGRKMMNEHSANPADTGMTLRGAAIAPDGSLGSEQLLDGLVCDCCHTDMAIATSGRIAVYRDRTAGEVRDIYIARQVDGRWQPGVPVADDDWNISGCPVNGPAVAASGDVVAVAWFTAADDEPRVQLRISRDSGESFGDAVLIARQDVMGQVDVEILDDNAVAVSWVDKGSRALVDQVDVKLMPVTLNGTKGVERIVGRTAYARVVPQMLLVDKSLIFVWTDVGAEQTRLASVRMPLLDDSEF